MLSFRYFIYRRDKQYMNTDEYSCTAIPLP